MKRLSLTRLLVAGLLATSASLASAQSADMSVSARVDARTPPTSQSTSQSTVPGSQYGAAVAGDGQARPQIDRNCLQTTGTHIRPRHRADQRCVSATGRVYSREDLDSTGHITIADALRTLDPSIR